MDVVASGGVGARNSGLLLLLALAAWADWKPENQQVQLEQDEIGADLKLVLKLVDLKKRQLQLELAQDRGSKRMGLVAVGVAKSK